MKKILKIVLILAIMMTALHFLTKTFDEVSDKDSRGYTPATLLNHYLTLCQEGKFDEALSLWTPESRDRDPNLKTYCQKIGTLNLEYSDTTEGAFNNTKIISAHVSGDETIRRYFYFELRNSNWHLHAHPLVKTD